MRVLKYSTESLVYLSIIYFAYVRPILLYLLKWWFYIDILRVGCELPIIPYPTHNLRLIYTIILVGYMLATGGAFVQRSDNVRFYFPSVHRTTGYVVYCSTIVATTLTLSIAKDPFVLLYCVWLGITLFFSWYYLSNQFLHKRWSLLFYGAIYGITLFQVVSSLLFTLKLEVSYLKWFIFATSLLLKFKSITILILLLMIPSLILNLIFHIGVKNDFWWRL